MRPRIKRQDNDIKITYSEMNKYLTENKCYGTYMSFIDKNIGLYRFEMMYRNNKKPPVVAEVEVSLVSKLVLKCSIDGVRTPSVAKFMELCKFGSH